MREKIYLIIIYTFIRGYIHHFRSGDLLFHAKENIEEHYEYRFGRSEGCPINHTNLYSALRLFI